MRISPKKLAFTLIELLTVIAIIAVLMGLLFPAIGAAKESAKKTQAKNDCVQIVTAVKAYYTEYGKYPLTGSSTSDYSSPGAPAATSNSAVINELRSNASATINPRQIVFLEVPDAKDSGAGATRYRSGVSPSAGGSGGDWYDPWGYAYGIAIDGNYDNQLKNPIASGTLYTGVVAWSLGKKNDKNETSDHVYSWK